MNLSEIDLFIDAISKYLTLNQPFTIVKEDEGLSWEPAYSVASKKDLQSVQIFSQYLFEEVGVFDFRTLPEEYFYKIRCLVDLLDRFIQDRKAKYGEVEKEIFEEAEDRLLALRLGGKVDYRVFRTIDQDLYNFIKINKLDKKCFALAIQLPKTLAIPFEGKEVLWNDLQRQSLTDLGGREYGYRFFYKDQFLMETDTNLLLRETFSVLYQGITFHHPSKALHITPLDKRDPLQWGKKNLLEIHTSTSKESFFLTLRKSDGFIYSIGVDKGKIAAPAKEYFEVSREECRREITSESAAMILKVFQNDKYYKKKMTQKKLLEVLEMHLGLDPIPELAIVTKHKILSYVTLPYAILKFVWKKNQYAPYGWRELCITPYKVSKIDKTSLKRWLECNRL